MISGNALKARGWAEGRLLGLAKKAGAALLAADAERDKDRVLDLLETVRADPAHYQGHVVLGDLAAALVAAQELVRLPVAEALRTAPLPYAIWGVEGIDQAARAQ